MSTFISWLPTTIAEWWQFLYTTYVPGCQFTFATLFMFIVGFNLVITLIGYAMHYKVQKGDMK